ncbi:MAG: MFS transporter [Chloroflexota bacterium]
MRSVVEPARLGSAVAMNSVTFNLARAVGPIAATTVIAAFGFGAGFLVNALSYVPVVLAMAVIHVRREAGGSTRPEGLPGTIATLRERPHLAGLLLVVAAIAFSSDPVGTLAPFLSTLLGRPDTDTGMVTGAFGIGGVTAALVMRTGERSLRRMAVEMLVMGVSVAALGVAFRFEVALVACFVAGFSYLTAQTAATTHLLLGTPAHVTGRIMALWGVAWLGVRPFASVIDGAIADVVGVQRASMLMALPVLLAGIAVLVAPRLVHGERPAPMEAADP